jgi:hypothetical protein
VSEAVRFIRTSRAPVLRPEILGLAGLGTIAAADPVGASASDALFAAFQRDDREAAIRQILSPFLGGMPVAALVDGPLREALARVGELWQHDERGIVVEHRAVDTCVQAIGLLRSCLPSPPATNPVALGGAPSGDPYVLPSLLTAAVLCEVGFGDVNLGPDVPVAAMERAVAEYRPSLVWLCLSVEPPQAGRREVARLAEIAAESGASLVAGGRGATRLGASGAQVLGSMTELAAFARGLLAAQASANGAAPGGAGGETVARGT